MMDKIKSHQQKIALAIGFVAVATIGFWGGLNINQTETPKPSVSASSSSNYSETTAAAQTVATPQPALEALTCQGKIKGSSTHKYHMPGGAFYKNTTKPIACFDTETQAKAAGFVKSSR